MLGKLLQGEVSPIMSSSAAILNRRKREGAERKMEEGYITPKEKKNPEAEVVLWEKAFRRGEILSG